VHQEHIEEANAHHGYGIYLVTWISLLLLTGLTVTVAGMHFRSLSIVVALAVASAKGSIVVSFFMHMREENRTLKIMLIVALVVLAIFIGVTFFDILFR